MSVTPSQIDLLSKLLDATALRQGVIGQNLSNVNTPGYRRVDVDFEKELVRLLQTDHSAKFDDLGATVFETQGLPERADGNNVDVDMEIGQLSKNVLLHQTYAQLLTSKFAMMRSAITGQ